MQQVGVLSSKIPGDHTSQTTVDLFLLPYSRNFSRTINFTVFVDFTATSKINPRKSYYSIQMQ